MQHYTVKCLMNESTHYKKDLKPVTEDSRECQNIPSKLAAYFEQVDGILGFK